MVNDPRCGWCLGDPLDEQYHDTEWGVPVHEDTLLFEFITLEGAQAGLSWRTVLHKRAHYRQVFHDFDIDRVARMTEADVERLLQDPGIIRNRLKVRSTISNAQAMQAVQSEFGSFSAYLWRHVNHQPLVNRWHSLSEVPTRTALSDQLSKDLKQRGFRFVGTTICYAYLQAMGLVNDHLVDCPRHAALSR